MWEILTCKIEIGKLISIYVSHNGKTIRLYKIYKINMGKIIYDFQFVIPM